MSQPKTGTRIEWGGYVDTAKLIPRPSDTRPFGCLGAPPKMITFHEGPASMQEYMSKPIGYRLVAAWALTRPLDRWDQ